jgi:hypothetical protein
MASKIWGSLYHTGLNIPKVFFGSVPRAPGYFKRR